MRFDLSDLGPSPRDQDLLALLVHRIGRRLGRTKLVKMMYMADYEAMRHLGHQISEFRWQRRDYGPFDPTFYMVDESLRDQVVTVDVEETRDGYEWHGYAPIGEEPEHSLSAAELRIIDHVIASYRDMDTNEFVETVVYETEPFKAVEGGPLKTKVPMEIVRGKGVEESDGLRLEDIEAGRERIRSGQGVPLAEALDAIRGRR